MSEFETQVALRMAVERAVEKEASVSADQVNQYVKDNGKLLTGKTEAEKKAEAEKILKDQKLQEAVMKWVEGARSAARVWFWQTSETGIQQ